MNDFENQGFVIEDPDQAKDARRKERNASKTLEEDIKWLMANPRGRRLAWWLLEITGLFRLSMTGSSWTYFNEGQRNIALILTDMLMDHAADKFFVMLNENRKKDAIDGRANDSDRAD